MKTEKINFEFLKALNNTCTANGLEIDDTKVNPEEIYKMAKKFDKHLDARTDFEVPVRRVIDILLREQKIKMYLTDFEIKLIENLIQVNAIEFRKEEESVMQAVVRISQSLNYSAILADKLKNFLGSTDKTFATIVYEQISKLK